ncbi:MAG: porphobilinogen synthase [Thermodesulfobacteriota bacterium]|tara:strand:+ start:11449 stop:12423 length:975 start_codon:yes stop_codon:yes gene_type:complete
MIKRGRKLRKSQNIRDLVQENTLTVNDLIQPLFIIEGKNKSEKIPSMPGIERKSLDLQLNYINLLINKGIKSIILFPSIDEKKKNSKATEALNPNGLIPKAIQKIKKKFPDLILITDIALDPYNSDGHDGILRDNEILNDETVSILVKQALLHAKCGADFVSPSDMMDGRVVRIREILDKKGFYNTGIISYAAKFASCLYGPFRDALNSEPKKGNKKSYQLNPANSNEALKELIDDENEGADMLIVKPASLYLDIILKAKSSSLIPIVAYQVSGEYSMIKFSAKNKLIDLDSAIFESLISMKRAGAKLIITYFAEYIANKLSKI